MKCDNCKYNKGRCINYSDKRLAIVKYCIKLNQYLPPFLKKTPCDGEHYVEGT